MGYKYLSCPVVTVTSKGHKPPSSLSTWARQTERLWKCFGMLISLHKGTIFFARAVPNKKWGRRFNPCTLSLEKEKYVDSVQPILFSVIWAPLTYFPSKRKCQNLSSFWVHDKTPQEPSVIWLGQNKFLARGMICLFLCRWQFYLVEALGILLKEPLHLNVMGQ